MEHSLKNTVTLAEQVRRGLIQSAYRQGVITQGEFFKLMEQQRGR